MPRSRNGLTLAFLAALGLLALFAASPGASQGASTPSAAPEACEAVTPITVTASQEGTNLILSWADSDANWYYDVYHGATADFVPAESNKLDSIHSEGYDGTIHWTNSWALLVTGDLYFVVRAQACDGSMSDSNVITVDKDDPDLPGVTFWEEHTGEATYYGEADGGGNCMFPPTPGDVMVAAVADYDYGADARLCGAVARVQGPYGRIQVRIVDRCPDRGCRPGHLDLHPEAFAKIAPVEYGRVEITWELVSPPIEGDIAYHFKDGSNPWWVAVQVRNHRNPLAKFEVLRNGSWVTLPRQEWNYFLAQDGLGRGPFTFRVTDVFGNQIVTGGVPLLDNATHPGGAQFPALVATSPPPPSFTPTDFVFVPMVAQR